MKFYIILLCLFSTYGIAQESYAILRKADRNLEKGRLRKALKLTQKADLMHDCFCGSCAMVKEKWITRIRANIFIREGNYQAVRDEIYDSSYGSTNPSFEIDSLLVVSYQIQFGKDSLSRMIDQAINLAYLENDTNIHVFVMLPLSNHDTLKLYARGSQRLWFNFSSTEKKEYLVHWKSEFPKSETYTLMKWPPKD